MTTSVQNQKFSLLLLRGTISQLRIVNTEEEFLQKPSDKLLAAGAGSALALAGMAGAATGALLSSSGSADSVQFFTCELDGKRLAGRFSKVWFADGDFVEAVAELQSDGSYAVFAVRRPSDHTLWMYPHCSRGKIAHRIYAIKTFFTIFAVLEISSLIWIYCQSFSLLEFFSQTSQLPIVIFSINALLISIYYPIRIGKKWMGFVVLAEQIFATLGFPDPKRVDMEKANSAFWKNPPKGEHQKVAPWVFRYLDPD